MKSKATAFTKKHIIHLLFFVVLFFCLMAFLRPQSRALEEQQAAAGKAGITATDTEGTGSGATSDSNQSGATGSGATLDNKQSDGTQADGTPEDGVPSSSDTANAGDTTGNNGDTTGSTGDTGVATNPTAPDVNGDGSSAPLDSTESNGGGYLSETVQELAQEVAAAAQNTEQVVVQSGAMLGDDGIGITPFSIHTGNGYWKNHQQTEATREYTDPIWDSNGYESRLWVSSKEGDDGLVTSQAELQEAIYASEWAVTANHLIPDSTIMCIIPIGASIELISSPIILNNTNVVLRRAESVWATPSLTEAARAQEAADLATGVADDPHVFYYFVDNGNQPYYLKMYDWNYATDTYLAGAYSNPKTISDPAMYDGIPDFDITLGSDYKASSSSTNLHIELSGTPQTSGQGGSDRTITSTLILENITLKGKFPANDTYVSVSNSDDINKEGGGIRAKLIGANTAINFTFAGNIQDVASASPTATGTEKRGDGQRGNAAIFLSGPDTNQSTNTNSPKLNFNMLGGVISHCGRPWDGGGAIYMYSCNAVNSQATISGYSIIENCYSAKEGGAIYASSNLTLRDHVQIRNNKGQAGPGGIFMHFAVDKSDNPLTLTLQDQVKVTGNEALAGSTKGLSQIWPGIGGGIYSRANVEITNTAAEIASGNVVEISGNIAAQAGGGIALAAKVDENGQSYSSGTTYGDENVPDGKNPTLTINGGKIINNTATGTNRELDAAASPLIKASMGSGGGIFAYARSKILIPDVSKVTFLGNKSDRFAAHLDLNDIRQNDTWKNTQSTDFGWKAFLGDTYDGFQDNTYATEQAAATKTGGHIFGAIPNYTNSSGAGIPRTGTGFTDEDPKKYNNLYNNYDIGVSNASKTDLYVQLERAAFPAGAGAASEGGIDRVGGIATTFPDGKGYKTLGGKAEWLEFNQDSGSLSFTATPATGYDFDYWSLTFADGKISAQMKKESLDIFGISYADANYETLFAGIFANDAGKADGAIADGTLTDFPDKIVGNQIKVFKMPAAHVKLTAHYNKPAELTASPVAFYAAKTGDAGYTQPGSKSVAITNNSPGTPATGVSVSLGSVTRDVGAGPITIPDVTYPETSTTAGDYFELGSGSFGTIAAGATTNINVQPKVGLPVGIYTAALNLSYHNGSATVNESQVVITFIVYKAGSAELPLISMTPELNFGQKDQGYVVTDVVTTPATDVVPQKIYLRNYGDAKAVVTNVELMNGDGSSDTISDDYPAERFKKKKENFVLNTNATDISAESPKEIPARGGGEGTFSEFPESGADGSFWSVKPITGLLDGTYTAQVRIRFNKVNADTGTVDTANAEFVVCYVTFEVKQAPINVSVPVKLMFAAFEYNYTGDVAQPVAVVSPKYEIVNHGTSKINVKVDFSKDGKWLGGTSSEDTAANDPNTGNGVNYQDSTTADLGTAEKEKEEQNRWLRHKDSPLPTTRSGPATPTLDYDNSIYLRFEKIALELPEVSGTWTNEITNPNALRLVPGYSGDTKQIGSIEQDEKLKFTIGGQYYGEFRPELKPKYNLIFTFALE
ncbi:hypothetical protein FACS1894111_06260 [Clostridia bacterium]|nr:hypothetical protein FACS1894111_06260 [Clostridia bacterium]